MDPPSAPSFYVDWYSKAMNAGMILNGPTIFGALGNRLLGGGEAGSEAVVGTQSLVGMIQNAVANASAMSQRTSTTINVYGAQGQDVRELANLIEQRIAFNTRRRRAFA